MLSPDTRAAAGALTSLRNGLSDTCTAHSGAHCTTNPGASGDIVTNQRVCASQAAWLMGRLSIAIDT